MVYEFTLVPHESSDDREFWVVGKRHKRPAEAFASLMKEIAELNGEREFDWEFFREIAESMHYFSVLTANLTSMGTFKTHHPEMDGNGFDIVMHITEDKQNAD